MIQDQLGELGVDVEIKGGEYTALEPDLLGGNFDAALLSRGYLVDVAEPAGYLISDYTCDGGYNLAKYCDPEVDQMLDDVLSIEDAEARNDVYAQIAEKLQGDAANLFLLHEGAAWGTQSAVEGFEPHPLEYYVLTADLALGG